MWHSPLALVALQAIAGALVAPPVYGLVLRARGDVALARFAAVVVWLYPPLAGLIFGDFHENGFAPAAVAWMLYCFDGGSCCGRQSPRRGVSRQGRSSDLSDDRRRPGWLRFRGTMPGMLALGIGIVSLVVAMHFFTSGQSHAIVSGAANTHWQPIRFYAWSGADVRDLFRSGVAARAGFVVLRSCRCCSCRFVRA